MTIHAELGKNLEALKKRFGQSDDMMFYSFTYGNDKCDACLIYIDGLTDNQLLAEYIISPVQAAARHQEEPAETPPSSISFGYRHTRLSSLKDAEADIFSGKSVLLAEGWEEALSFETETFKMRDIEEPASEVLERGPRIGFVEKLRTNTALLREQSGDPNLQIKEITLGERTKKRIAVAYIRDIAPDDVVKEVMKRLDSITIDDIPESGAIEQLIEDNTYSIFPTVLTTERPDRVMGALLEGRVSILVDGTPFTLLVPTTIDEFIHSPDDYNQRWVPVTFLRLLRYTCILITIYLPGLYISLVTFHTGLLPTRMAVTIAGSRLNVPFPPFVEAFIMIFTIEMIREAGLRLPKPIGQTIGLIGGVVIGQAAVQANIVSAMMVIVVSITALASFTAPSYAFNFPLRLIRIFSMILSAILGLYGLIMCYLLVVGHLMRLKSFGQDYLIPIMAQPGQDLKDTIVRLPTPHLKKRPSRKETKDKIKQR
ncbi:MULTISPECIES: spore germination protein [Bacillus]|uniref:spore germination protein n=1 Tax=Bacillus TaxID=1386 RepID=UPI0018EE3A26|nr:spore germination protein [Bacillus velezensis]MCM3445735.1 spore germination protein [Bacillus velezensis]MED3229348.1 spore germination protein [Bacillus velezensis]MED4624448.1 spore germination protein [Bacillus velezensis]QPV77174.1 spore germination protein [Bacillus velezensis]